jgi:hypothetical protein
MRIIDAFVTDEVFETIDEAREAVEWLISCYEGNEGPFVYPMRFGDGYLGYVKVLYQ